MPRVIGIGHQDFVTLITRPRRFGKTLNMSMTEQFFSVGYRDKKSLFENLSIWKDEKYRKLQGTYPVISLSFANVKETIFSDARKVICQIIADLYQKFDFVLESGCLNDEEQKAYRQVSVTMEKYMVSGSLRALSGYLSRYYGKKSSSCWMSMTPLCRKPM